MPRVQSFSGRAASCSWASLVLVLCLLGCDRGLYYKPVGWERQGPREWASPTQGFVLYTSGPGGLAGAEDAAFGLGVVNRGAVPVIFDDAVLNTQTRQYRSPVGPSSGELVWRIVPPGQTKPISLQFILDEPNTRIFGESFELVIHYHLGTGPEQSLVARFVKE